MSSRRSSTWSGTDGSGRNVARLVFRAPHVSSSIAGSAGIPRRSIPAVAPDAHSAEYRASVSFGSKRATDATGALARVAASVPGSRVDARRA